MGRKTETFELTGFAPGTDVAVFPRTSDIPPTVGGAKTEKVGKDGVLKLSGLEPNAPYVAAAEVPAPGTLPQQNVTVTKTVTFVAKTDAVVQGDADARSEALRQGRARLGSDATPHTAGARVPEDKPPTLDDRGVDDVQARPSASREVRETAQSSASRTNDLELPKKDEARELPEDTRTEREREQHTSSRTNDIPVPGESEVERRRRSRPAREAHQDRASSVNIGEAVEDSPQKKRAQQKSGEAVELADAGPTVVSGARGTGSSTTAKPRAKRSTAKRSSKKK